MVYRQHTKLVYFVCIFCIIGSIVFISILGRSFIQTREYIPIYAEILGHDKELGTTNENSQDVTKYIYYTYSYKGVEYTTKQRVLTFFNKKVGSQKKIYINPLNPNQVKDNTELFLFAMCLLICILGSIMSVGAIISSRA